MSPEDLEKSLQATKDFFKNNPQEVKKILDEMKDLTFEGPTLDEYLLYDKYCRNQQMSIDMIDKNHISKPIGEIHGEARSWEMIDDMGKNWGIWRLCEDCIQHHKNHGWSCNDLEEKK